MDITIHAAMKEKYDRSQEQNIKRYSLTLLDQSTNWSLIQAVDRSVFFFKKKTFFNCVVKSYLAITLINLITYAILDKASSSTSLKHTYIVRNENGSETVF